MLPDLRPSCECCDADFPDREVGFEPEVTFELELPRRRRFPNVPRTGTTRMLFGAEWLAASGVDPPSNYAPEVARHVQLAAVSRWTPDQWRELVVGFEAAARVGSGIEASSAGDGPGLAMFHLREEIGSANEDENHVVFFLGGFRRSERAGLPPVAGRGLDWPPTDGNGDGWPAFGPHDGDR